ncbi:hypothetical protein LHJ74_29205 [Streptomyces sp. N2-109]|uniref:Uncharacterized protein n=1 Tax=Streptomyces gossypii TaxID=2883101 RepID=A0ABT2K195_9ACTN|nr:hypothetical protein [Streptomyces gossypii]MCT2593938.1 hypothetical protein [Streptomyces gossypii]
MAGKPPEAGLTQAQERAVTGADPDSGEVRAGAPTRQRLERLGLARPHGRLGAHYLTDEGRAVRARIQERDRAAAPAPAGESSGESSGGGFAPLTGDESERGPSAASRSAHAASAARGWEALLEIRRLTQPGSGPASPSVPAPWERARPVHAVALALEAAGIPASAMDGSGRRVRTGYRVSPGEETATVRVEWRTAAGAAAEGADDEADTQEQLAACARRLTACGWDTERYLGARRRPYLVVSPQAPRRG